MFAEFDNSTSRSVVPRAYIIQTQTFIARGTKKQKCSVVGTLSGDIVSARSRETWHGRAIKIPPVGPSILQCRIIRVEYMLKVSRRSWIRLFTFLRSHHGSNSSSSSSSSPPRCAWTSRERPSCAWSCRWSSAPSRSIRSAAGHLASAASTASTWSGCAWPSPSSLSVSRPHW